MCCDLSPIAGDFCAVRVERRRMPCRLYPHSPAEVSSTRRPPAKLKKTLVRRVAPDRSQQIRRAVQFAFLLLNAVIGVQFVLWVRYFESGGTTHYFERPAGVDGWLPIAGLMNLRYFLAVGQIPPIHPSAMVLLCVFLLASVLVKKAFCSWLCPVGTVSEYLWKLGRKVFKRNLVVPKWLDRAAARIEVSSAGFLCLHCFHDAGDGSGGFSGVAVRDCGGCEDAELLPLHGHRGHGSDSGAGGAVGGGAEFLVPVSLPVRRADGDCFGAEPGEDSARRGGLHRLRQMQQGVPIASAGGQAGADPVGGVHGVHGVRCGVSRGECAADGADAAEGGDGGGAVAMAAC